MSEKSYTCNQAPVGEKRVIPDILIQAKAVIEDSLHFQSQVSDDGRINSCIDEFQIQRLLSKNFGDKYYKHSNSRHW